VAPGAAKGTVLRLGGLCSLDLVRHLESENGWQRETAQRLLFERQDGSVRPALEQLVRRSPAPLGRLHALYTLSGLDSLSDDVLVDALGDKEPRIRAHAVRLCEPSLRRSPALLAAAVRLTDDVDPLVRFQLALSLGEAPGEAAVEPIARLAQQVEDDGLLSTAILMSVAGNADQVARRLLWRPSSQRTPNPRRRLPC
jgi:HEAT repeat protein